jgi:hypothetical protein
LFLFDESVGDSLVPGLPRVEIFLFSRAEFRSGDKDSGGRSSAVNELIIDAGSRENGDDPENSVAAPRSSLP